MADQPHEELQGLVEGLIRLGREREQVSVADIQDEVGQRSFGPFLFVPALVEISPVGGIPGLPTLLAVIVALFALQMLFGRKHLWLPDLLTRRKVAGDKLERGLCKLRPVIRWLDKLIRPRLHWATNRNASRLLALLCLVLAASVPTLELIPFASSGPFAAIGLIGIGLTTRDGLLVLLGLLMAAVSAYLASGLF
jgi:hypothetical protein